MIAGVLLWLFGAISCLAGLAVIAMGFGVVQPISPEFRGLAGWVGALVGLTIFVQGLAMMVFANMAQEIADIRRLISKTINRWQSEQLRAPKKADQ